MNLEVKIGPLTLKNPVMTASGTFGYGREYSEFVDLSRLGAVVVKGLSVAARAGNPTPRIVETASGMLNAIGLQNIGVDRFLSEELPFLRRFDTAVIANFFGDSVSEYVEAAEKLSAAEGVHALEMNISCPNKQAGWIVFGTDPKVASEVIGAVRKKTKLPLIVKLSPNVTDIVLMSKVAMDSGADALSLINTLLGTAIDIRTRKPKLANITGGLSGPAIKPVALRMVYQVYRELKAPIIGMGGIMNAEDALEFLMAGASAVAVGTANFVNPKATIDIMDGISAYMKQENVDAVSALTGVAHAS